MRKKIVLVQVIILVIASFLMLGTVSYAWFSKFDKTDVIFIDSASLKVDAKLFYKQNLEDEYIEKSNGVAVSIQDMIPGDTFYFKIEVTNTGTIPGRLNIDTYNVLISEGHENVFEYIVGGFKYAFEAENKIYENELVEPNETLKIEFQIYINGNLTNEDSSNNDYLSLIIEKIVIKLDQIQP